MKKQIIFLVLGVMLLLIPGALWAVNQAGVSQDTPAILVSLGQANAIPLDDAAAAAVRGQAPPPLYVLVRIIGLNTYDDGPGVTWTSDPYQYRYGYYGGANYGTPGNTPVDRMDELFLAHDNNQISNAKLLLLLALLPKTYDHNWGNIYISHPDFAPDIVNVNGFSLIGGRIFRNPVPMPFSEYSRREAMYGMGILTLINLK
jgi:hypothetical protein